MRTALTRDLFPQAPLGATSKDNKRQMPPIAKVELSESEFIFSATIKVLTDYVCITSARQMQKTR